MKYADLRRENAELVEALEAMLNCYEGVYDMAGPTRHQSDEAKRAEGLARAALAKARDREATK